jgi:hypothetical protein
MAAVTHLGRASDMHPLCNATDGKISLTRDSITCPACKNLVSHYKGPAESRTVQDYAKRHNLTLPEWALKMHFTLFLKNKEWVLKGHKPYQPHEEWATHCHDTKHKRWWVWLVGETSENSKHTLGFVYGDSEHAAVVNAQKRFPMYRGRMELEDCGVHDPEGCEVCEANAKGGTVRKATGNSKAPARSITTIQPKRTTSLAGPAGASTRASKATPSTAGKPASKGTSSNGSKFGSALPFRLKRK